MLKLLWFLMVSMLLASSTFATSVDLNVEFVENKAIYTYLFYFSQNDSIDSFSFEKPRDSRLLGAFEGENVIPVKIVGDFFLISPDESTKNKSFEVSFESKTGFNTIVDQNSFSTYVNFNFDVDYLEFVLDFSYFNVSLGEVFPREYVLLGNDKLMWKVDSVTPDMFFLIDLTKIDEGEVVSSVVEDKVEDSFNFFYFLIFFGFLFFMGMFFFLLGQFKATKSKVIDKNEVSGNYSKGKEKFEEKDIVDTLEVEIDSNSEDSGVDVEDKKEEEFKNYLGKYLTENEQEVVKIVKEFSGIAQNDILNHLPSLTKSNLSKIISKLHVKHVLNRIRVGKVNKIYLGDKFSGSLAEKE